MNLLDFLLPDCLEMLIPDGTDKTLESNGNKVHVTKKNGKLKIKVNSKFDDTEVKQMVAELKKSLNDLDDCVFVETIEDLGENFDKKRLDYLMNLGSYTRKEAEETEMMIDVLTTAISEHLQRKIEELIELQERF